MAIRLPSSKAWLSFQERFAVLEATCARLEDVVVSLRSENRALQERMVFLEAEKAAFEAREAGYKAEITCLEGTVKGLETQLKQAKRRTFGARSEKKVAVATEAGSSDEEEDGVLRDLFRVFEDELERSAFQEDQPTPCGHGGRQRLPTHLPRTPITYTLKGQEGICICCGRALRKIGEVVSEQLDVEPARAKVIRHVRTKYACSYCEGSVKVAPMPPQPLPKSMASPGLLAHVLLHKWVAHVPLYRQEQLGLVGGIHLDRATLCQWVQGCGDLLQRVVEGMERDLLASPYIQADETPFQVLREPGKTAHSRSFMNVYRSGASGAQQVIFRYEPHRKGEAPERFLGGFAGYLQTDGYAGYKKIKQRDDVLGVGCMAHCRRKFVEAQALSEHPGHAALMVRGIGQLYALEKRGRVEGWPVEVMYQQRQAYAVPLLAQMKGCLEAWQERAPPGTLIGRAIKYALGLWDELCAYTQDGCLQIDNNAIENTIRPFALGRKNWLFAHSSDTATKQATLWSVVATCKANQVDTRSYLQAVLTLLPQVPKDDDIRHLLPYTIAPEVLKAYAV